MKRKSITILLAVVLVLVMSLTVLSACNKKHNYSADWKSDADGHWHECVTKKHTDTTPKENHVWDAGVVRTAATEDAKGVMVYTCTICKFEKQKRSPRSDTLLTQALGSLTRTRTGIPPLALIPT